MACFALLFPQSTIHPIKRRRGRKAFFKGNPRGDGYTHPTAKGKPVFTKWFSKKNGKETHLFFVRVPQLQHVQDDDDVRERTKKKGELIYLFAQSRVERKKSKHRFFFAPHTVHSQE